MVFGQECKIFYVSIWLLIIFIGKFYSILKDFFWLKTLFYDFVVGTLGSLGLILFTDINKGSLILL